MQPFPRRLATVAGLGFSLLFVGCTGQAVVTAPAAPVTAAGYPATLARSYDVTTYAGGSQGSQDGPRAQATFDYPSGLAFDRQGDLIVSEQGSTKIRRIAASGAVTTLVGGTEGFQDGALATARFGNPINLSIDKLGLILVADTFQSNRIRRVDLSSGVTTLVGGTLGFADGPAATAKLNNPTAMVTSDDGSITIADAGNNRIRRLYTDGRVTTVAGSAKGFADGPGSEAKFDNPTGIALDTDGTLWVADTGNNRIRRISVTGAVTTLAGGDKGFADGPAKDAKFNGPVGITVDSKRNLLIIDSFNHRVRALAPTGQVVTLAGAGDGFAEGTGLKAQFSSPFGVAADPSGAIYVSDMGNHRIRRLMPANN